MAEEIELQFIDIDVDTFRDRLEEVGATSIHGPLVYKSSYLYIERGKDNYSKFIRIRIEGTVLTVTIKETGEGFAKELEYASDNIDMYDETVSFFTSLVPDVPVVTVEKRSEKWKYDDIMINIDQWPGLPKYIEVEGPGEEDLFEFMRDLGYENGTKLKYFKHGAFDYYVHLYGVPRDVLRSTSLTFDTIDTFLEKYKK